MPLLTATDVENTQRLFAKLGTRNVIGVIPERFWRKCGRKHRHRGTRMGDTKLLDVFCRVVDTSVYNSFSTTVMYCKTTLL